MSQLLVDVAKRTKAGDIVIFASVPAEGSQHEGEAFLSAVCHFKIIAASAAVRDVVGIFMGQAADRDSLKSVGGFEDQLGIGKYHVVGTFAVDPELQFCRCVLTEGSKPLIQLRIVAEFQQSLCFGLLLCLGSIYGAGDCL